MEGGCSGSGNSKYKGPEVGTWPGDGGMMGVGFRTKWAKGEEEGSPTLENQAQPESLAPNHVPLPLCSMAG